MNPVRAFVLAAVAAALLAPAFADTAAAQASSLTEKMNAYVGCINRLSERSYESRKRYFSWAAQSGPTGKERIIYGTYTIYDTTGLPEGRREGQRARAARRGARSRSVRLRRRRGQARAAAQGGRRLLFPGELQGRPDGQGQGAASASRRRVGSIRERRPGASQRRRSRQRQARGRAPRRDRAERRPQGALPCRGADDPRQARAARGGDAQSRPRRDHPGAERIRKSRQGDRADFGQRTAAQRSARSSSATPRRSSSPRSS